jgi:hypothetical protein
LDEETKHVQEYDYLGTDAVGNPSAGTYAHSGKYEVKVESVSDEEAREITEAIGSHSDERRDTKELAEELDSLREKLGIDKLAEELKSLNLSSSITQKDLQYLQSKINEQSNGTTGTTADSGQIDT